MSKSYSQIISQKLIVNKIRDDSISARYCFVALAVIMGLLAIPAFKGLWHLWQSENFFEGLLLVPFFCGFILYRRKDEFIQCRPKPVKRILYLLPITLGGMLVASSYDLPRIAGLLLVINLLIASFGILGYSNYKLFLGPLIFLMLMVPPPQWAVDFITIGLQKLFSATIETVFVGSDRFLECQGIVFWFSGMDRSLIIGPECSGIRSLLGIVIISSYFANLGRHSIVTAILMISASVATALALNFIRILATMQLRLNGLEQYSVGFWHGLLGMLVFLIGILILSRLSLLLKPVEDNRKEEK